MVWNMQHACENGLKTSTQLYRVHFTQILSLTLRATQSFHWNHKISTSSAVGCVNSEVRGRTLAQASDNRGSSEFIHHCPETHGQRHTQAEFNVAPDNLSIMLCDTKARLALHFCIDSLLCFFVSLVFHLRSVARLVSLSYPIFLTTTTSKWPRSCAGSSYPLGLLLLITDKHPGMA
jgi:hypothetical protein